MAEKTKPSAKKITFQQVAERLREENPRWYRTPWWLSRQRPGEEFTSDELLKVIEELGGVPTTRNDVRRAINKVVKALGAGEKSQGLVETEPGLYVNPEAEAAKVGPPLPPATRPMNLMESIGTMGARHRSPYVFNERLDEVLDAGAGSYRDDAGYQVDPRDVPDGPSSELSPRPFDDYPPPPFVGPRQPVVKPTMPPMGPPTELEMLGPSRTRTRPMVDPMSMVGPPKGPEVRARQEAIEADPFFDPVAALAGSAIGFPFSTNLKAMAAGDVAGEITGSPLIGAATAMLTQNPSSASIADRVGPTPHDNLWGVIMDGIGGKNNQLAVRTGRKVADRLMGNPDEAVRNQYVKRLEELFEELVNEFGEDEAIRIFSKKGITVTRLPEGMTSLAMSGGDDVGNAVVKDLVRQRDRLMKVLGKTKGEQAKERIMTQVERLDDAIVEAGGRGLPERGFGAGVSIAPMNRDLPVPVSKTADELGWPEQVTAEQFVKLPWYQRKARLAKQRKVLDTMIQRGDKSFVVDLRDVTTVPPTGLKSQR